MYLDDILIVFCFQILLFVYSMRGNIMLRHSLLADMLHECQQTKDLTVVCRDGHISCNYLLFSAIFRWGWVN